MDDKWNPERGEKFYTYGDEPDDPVQPLTWGARLDHDQLLLDEGRVFKTKVEAEAAKLKKWMNISNV